MKRPSPLVLVTIATVLLLGVAATAAGVRVKTIAAAASAGKAQAKSGARSLAAMDATAAASQFADANESFKSVDRALGPEWVSGAIEWFPWAGRQYVAVRSLARIGSDGSLAGVELANALRQTPSAEVSAGPPGQLGAALTSRLAHIDGAVSRLADAADRASQLSPDGLVRPLADAVRSVQAMLLEATPFLNRSHALLQLKSYLLSGNHRIIVVSQDGAELRPTGGWAGSYGIVSIGSAGLRLDSYQDVFTLPDPPGRVTPPIGALQTNDFNFRNANWWLDFPTSAEKMLGFWRSYGEPPVDGIVVIDTVVMADLLEVVGPITVPDFNETFTSKNLLDRLLYLTQVVKGGQIDRKDVLVVLAQELEKRVLQASPGDLAKCARVLAKAADAKHVQMYFTDPQAEAAVDAMHWSGRVSPPEHTTDMVAISNAMNKPGKVNIAMKKSIAYDVSLKPDRSAETRLVLGYSNTGLYLPSLPGDFRDWLRVYRMPGTVFPTRAPDGSKPTVMTEFGFPAQAHGFMLTRGQSTDVALSAKVPNAFGTAAPARPGETAVYRLYLVRQADLEDIPTAVTVHAPQGWHITASTARLIASGTSLPVSAQPDRARMTVPLSGDISLDVELTPSF